MRKSVLPHANNKNADQPAQLINTFGVRCFDSIIYIVSISEISKPVASFCG